MNVPRQARTRAFWKYVRTNEKKTPERLRVMNEDGISIQPEDMENHPTKVANTLLDSGNRVERIDRAAIGRPPVDLEVTGAEVKAALAWISQDSAVGPDKIPANLLKELNDVAYENIFDIFNQILNGTHDVFKEWRKGRVSLLEKSNSRKEDLASYRPITVSDVLYRVFTNFFLTHPLHLLE